MQSHLLHHQREQFTSESRLSILKQRQDHQLTLPLENLVIDGLCGISEIKDHNTMRLGSSTVGKLPREVNRPIEAQSTIIKDINIQSLVIRWGVHNADLSCLNEVISDNDMLLIWSDLDVMGSDSWLILIGVVETLDVIEVGDVESGDVVRGGEGEVEEFTVGGEIGVDCYCVACFWAEVVEEFSDTLGTGDGVGAEWINDPYLTKGDGSSDRCAVFVAGDELHVLDSASLDWI